MFDNQYMNIALSEAKKAYDKGEIPVGCIIVQQPSGIIVAQSHNLSETQKNPNLHAEMIAINEACSKLDSKNLANCDIYVTLEPCVMCASAISNARIKRLFYSCPDVKQGGVENGVRFYTTASCFHRPEIYNEILSSESLGLITSFFRKIRTNKI
ncbi:MAG: nucleoside deaminase [Rickettsiales bacterium]|nr:MAG: nucleoside deaminase [Rickettsiales bacterium]